MKKRPVELALEQLARNPLGADEVIRKALADRSASVVVTATRRLLDLDLPGMTAELVAAYERFLQDPIKRDPGCRAKTWLLKALERQGYYEHEFYVRAIAYRQLEPVFGGNEDTAVELRGLAAMGLAGSGWDQAAEHIVPLLVDRATPARISGVRALCGLGELLVLRLKALQEDEEPQVTAECLEALLILQGAHALEFVLGFLDGGTELGEMVALALGASRLPEAFPPLRAAWEARFDRRTLLIAMATLRIPVADEFLRELVAAGADGIEVLEPFGFFSLPIRESQ